MKQKFKNMWVEWRYGFKYYDFPWEIKSKHTGILEYFSIKEKALSNFALQSF